MTAMKGIARKEGEREVRAAGEHEDRDEADQSGGPNVDRKQGAGDLQPLAPGHEHRDRVT
jgi:hypothetical protein